MNLSLAKFLPQVGLDIGTSAIRLKIVGQDTLVEEPSCIRVDSASGEILAFGRSAADAQGRSGDVRYLVTGGVVDNPQELKPLVNQMLQQAGPQLFLAQPTYLISVPAGATQVESLANAQVGRLLGGREVMTVSSVLAASIGAKVPLDDSAGCFIFHLGAGRVEVATIALGSVVAVESSVNAGDYLKNKLASLFQIQRGLRLAQSDLATVLHRIVSLNKSSGRHQVIRGQSTTDGKLHEIDLGSDEFYESVLTYGQDLVKLVERLFGRLSPDLLVETPVRGLLLSGGLAQLDGLDGFLSDQLKIPVSIVDQPDRVVALGLEQILRHKQEFWDRITGGQNGSGMIDWS